jgi:hypothetical protein
MEYLLFQPIFQKLSSMSYEEWTRELGQPQNFCMSFEFHIQFNHCSETRHKNVKIDRVEVTTNATRIICGLFASVAIRQELFSYLKFPEFLAIAFTGSLKITTKIDSRCGLDV